MVNTVTNKVSRVLGKDETLRFLNVSLYQGAPAKKGITTLAMAASANPLLQDKATRDPHVFSTAYKKPRFYVFGRSDREEKGDRDVFNERPTREEQTVAVAPEKKKPTATSLTIHTTMGDIVRPSLSRVDAKHSLTISALQALSRCGAQDSREFCHARPEWVLQQYHFPPNHQEIHAPDR